MLSESHNRAYQEFSILLKKFKNDCSDLNQTSTIKGKFQHLQVYFQEDILPLTDEELDREIAPRWRAVQTEIMREFRLLSTDILFLTSSAKTEMIAKRGQSVRERIDQLNSYCQIMLGKER
ncbi:MAG: heterocyst frequency control protein PatD [Pleurocapsa sp.]